MVVDNRFPSFGQQAMDAWKKVVTFLNKNIG